MVSSTSSNKPSGDIASTIALTTPEAELQVHLAIAPRAYVVEPIGHDSPRANIGTRNWNGLRCKQKKTGAPKREVLLRESPHAGQIVMDVPSGFTGN